VSGTSFATFLNKAERELPSFKPSTEDATTDRFATGPVDLWVMSDKWALLGDTEGYRRRVEIPVEAIFGHSELSEFLTRRALIYAQFSSDLQRATSLEDQIATARLHPSQRRGHSTCLPANVLRQYGRFRHEEWVFGCGEQAGTAPPRQVTSPRLLHPQAAGSRTSGQWGFRVDLPANQPGPGWRKRVG
jgi:hypothetical protein